MAVGFIGLGNMGGPICRRVIAKSGRDVVFFDLRPEAVAAVSAAGGTAAGSVAEVAAASDVVFTSLPTPAAMEVVTLGDGGLAETLRPGSVYVDLTTNAPALVKRVGAVLAERDVAMLDAPVSGGPAGAEAATLSVLVGGDEDVFDAQLPLLRTFAASPFHLGPLGSGTVTKLVNNLLAICNMTTAAEGLMLGAAAGLDPAKLDEAIRRSSGTSMGYTALADHALSGDYTPSMALEVAYKDVRLALELAGDVNVPTPHGAQAANLLRMAIGMGHAKDDPTAVFRVYEETLGRKVRAELAPA